MATLEDLTDLSGRVYNVLNHGVTGDGATDDTAGFVTAISAAPAGSILWLPPGTYKTDLINFNKSLVVWGEGAIIQPFSTPTTKLVKIGNDDGSRLNRFTLRGLRIQLGARDWTTDIVGLQIINTCYVDTYDLEIALMKRGIEIKGITGEQCLYHNHRIRHINTCLNHVRITHDGAGSVNEINFYGGNYDYNANNYDMTGTVLFWSDPDGHTPNITNIRFFGPCFQAASSTTKAAQIDGGNGIYMDGARFETADGTDMPFNIVAATNTGMVEVNAIGAACDIDWNDATATSLLRYRGNRITGQQLITPNDNGTQQAAGEAKILKGTAISGQQSDLVQLYDVNGKGSRFDNAGNGLIKHKIISSAANRVATVNDAMILLTGVITHTLPSLASMSGRDLEFFTLTSGTIATIDGNGATINGQSTLILTGLYQYVKLRATDTEWIVLSGAATINIISGGSSSSQAGQAVTTGSNVQIERGDTLSLNITGLGSLTGRSKLWFSVKASLSDVDSRSLLMVEESAGLLYINKAAAPTPSNASISVTDATTGALTVTVAAIETAKLAKATALTYDVQMLDGNGVVRTLLQGLAAVVLDVTRAVS